MFKNRHSVSALRWTKENVLAATEGASSISEALARLGLGHTGGNGRTLKRYIDLWSIPTSFVPYEGRLLVEASPLEEILVENSTYKSSYLKKGLIDAGLKKNICEICGQDDNWHGKKLIMILDHINGKHNVGGRVSDNRIENLRIICPNCNSTLVTHCSKNRSQEKRSCSICGELITSTLRKFCSRKCYMSSRIGEVRKRKTERPPYEILKKEVEEFGYATVGRKYKVTDNAVRFWIRRYEKNNLN